MIRAYHLALTKSLTSCLKKIGKLSLGLCYVPLVLGLAATPVMLVAGDTHVRFTASIDGVVGQDRVTLSAATEQVQGEIWFKQSNHLEPGFYDGHTWQNAVKQVTFDWPINATFSGMSVSLYPDQGFISVFYNADKCPHIGIVCSAHGETNFTLSDGTETDFKALSYHFHLPDSEKTHPKLAAVIERFVAHAGKGTTKALVRYQSNDSREPILTLLMTIESIERIDTRI